MRAVKGKKTPEKLTMRTENETVEIIERKLNNHSVRYKMMEHAPEGSCEKVSILRGNPLKAAAKALLLNVKITNKQTLRVLAVVPGDSKVDYTKVAEKFRAKSADMAQREQVEGLTGCTAGRVPPFSLHPEVSVIVDNRLIEENEKIYFSPGRLDRSIEMLANDFKNLILKEDEKGEIFSFTVPLTTLLTTPSPVITGQSKNEDASSPNNNNNSNLDENNDTTTTTMTTTTTTHTLN